MQTIKEIKEQFQIADADTVQHLIEEYRTDTRQGVQRLIKTAQQQQQRLQAERARMEQMWAYERQYSQYTHIAGMDEVGRGPLAGPVVTCAVILPRDCDLLYINDSKKLSQAMRETLYAQICEAAVAFHIGMVDHEVIDSINILQATYEAMRQSVAGLSVTPDLLLNDAVSVPEISIPQVPIIKGDEKSASIAAASIVAKVTRDRFMEEMDEKYPEYDFASNKGYGSAKHIAALRKYGPCPIHRRSFLKKLL